MSAGKSNLTDMAWKVVEEMYLQSATEQQKAEYAGMTQRAKWGVLKPFLLSRSKTERPNQWMKLMLGLLSVKANRSP